MLFSKAGEGRGEALTQRWPEIVARAGKLDGGVLGVIAEGDEQKSADVVWRAHLGDRLVKPGEHLVDWSDHRPAGFTDADASLKQLSDRSLYVTPARLAKCLAQGGYRISHHSVLADACQIALGRFGEHLCGARQMLCAALRIACAIGTFDLA